MTTTPPPTRLDTQLLKGSSDLLILTALTKGPLHGYGLARALELKTAGALLMNEGVLYPTLHRLEAEGHVTTKWVVVSAGRRRKVYSLTATGRRRLAKKRLEWNQFVHVIGRVLEVEHA